MVKSLGDGMMLEFPHVHGGNCNRICDSGCECDRRSACQQDRRLHLAHRHPRQPSDRRRSFDVYGHGVNLAARLTTLAGPDEIVVSADVRDQLTPALDAEIEDLGECYVKHVEQPVRAFRVGAPGEQPVIERGRSRRRPARNYRRYPIPAASAASHHR